MPSRSIPWFGVGTAVVLGWIYVPIVYGLVSLWVREPEYAQGIILCALAAYLIWERREEACWEGGIDKPKCWWGGLLILNVGLAMLVVGRAATEFFSQRVSFVVVLWGLLGYALGPQGLKRLWEAAILFMMAVPFPAVVVDSVTLPLKTIVSRLAAHGLTVMGYRVIRYGNIIDLPEFRMEVVSACSGIRSFFALLAISIVLSTDMRSNRGRALLLLALIPIVILTNALRIMATAVLGLHFPQHGIEYYDGWVGWAAFALAFGGIYLLRKRMDGRRTDIESNRHVS